MGHYDCKSCGATPYEDHSPDCERFGTKPPPTEGTDMNQIEKIARAIWDQQRNHWGHYRDMVPDLCEWEELTQSKQRELMREAKAAIAAMPVQAEPVAGWIVGDADQDKWRTWGALGPEWTTDRDKATRYARRCDAEQVHAEDMDAWHVVPFFPPRPQEAVMQSERREPDANENPYSRARLNSESTKLRAEITRLTEALREADENINLKADFIDATINQLAAKDQDIYELKEALRAADEREKGLREALVKADEPHWFYAEGYEDRCLYSPDDAIDLLDFDAGEYVTEVATARPCRSIWCAVRVTDDEDADERFTFTEHDSEEAARAALKGPSHDA